MSQVSFMDFKGKADGPHFSNESKEAKKAHVVVLCAKLKEGKTRLSKDTGSEFAKDISCAMLLDIMVNVSSLPHSTDFILYYAPPESRDEAVVFLKTLGESAADRWTLLPMPSQNDEDLRSSQLSFKLSYALNKMSLLYNAITFIGSDCPTLHTNALLKGSNVAIDGRVFVCPAEDGGYVLISVPSSVSSDVFLGVEWSALNTLQSQISRVKSCGLHVEIGDTFVDVDTQEDIYKTRSMLLRKDDGGRSRTLDVILTKYPLEA